MKTLASVMVDGEIFELVNQAIHCPGELYDAFDNDIEYRIVSWRPVVERGHVVTIYAKLIPYVRSEESNDGD